MKEFIKYVGLDVHKETIAVSVAEGQGGEARYIGDSQYARGNQQADQATQER